MENDQDSSHHILNALNNDCIGEILDRLNSVIDLLNASKVCQRFQQCAGDCFRSKYSMVRINSDVEPFGKMPHVQMQRVLAAFGHLISSIGWAAYRDRQRDDEIFQSIVRYCRKTLKCLEVSKYDFTLNEQHNFEALENLGIYMSQIRIVSLDVPLKILHVNYYMELDENPWFLRAFPHLEELYFDSVYALSDDMLTELFSLNPQLQRLEIINCMGMTSNLFISIGRYVQNLRYLRIRTLRLHENSEDKTHHKNIIAPFGHLRNLKNLILEENSELSFEVPFEIAAENSLPIETLEFTAMPPKNSDVIVPTLQTLKHLHLYYGNISIDMLKKFIKNHIALEKIILEFHLNATETIKSATKYLSFIKRENYDNKLFELKYSMFDGKIEAHEFYTILKLAENRANVTIKIHKGQICVPKDVRRANQKWLNIL
ncbi:uncharacterized protein LOC116343929 [Contarinia nasturtii]|uniref:uncharacterized protein LOC116343929 n=1 Tax=Contarinia nasturtii TaxID=265458 RepID=UPI0012D3BDDD|nr:uncharacterized protein LOC116343929 [Contarinia nasturtii]